MAKLPSEADLIGNRPSLAVSGGGVAGPRVPDAPRGGMDAEALAMGKVGEALGKLGDTMHQVMEKEQDHNDGLRAEDAFNQLRNKQLDLTLGKENGFTNVRGRDAATAPILDQWTDKFDASTRAIEGTLANPKQLEKFKSRAAIAKAQFQGELLRHSAQESDVYAKDVLKTTFDTEIRNIGAAPQDELAAGISFERVNAAVATEGRRLGKDAATIAADQAKAGDALWTSRLEAWRLKDPVGAMAAFQDNQQVIGPHVRVQIAESLYRDAAPVLAAQLNQNGGPPVTATALTRPARRSDAPPTELKAFAQMDADEQQRVLASGGVEKLPRGIRNNNPGNIVSSPTRWQGEIEGSDPKYASFATPEAGIRALGKNLLSYQAKGIDTVEAIIARWAPATENDTAAYVKQVAKEIGVDPREPLNLKDRKTLTALATAIIKHENGTVPYAPEQVSGGIDAAINGKPFAYEAKRTPAFQAASLTNMTAGDALTVVTGNPVIDRLPPDQKIGVFHMARTQANQGAQQAREALKARLVDTVSAYERGLDSPNPPSSTELISVFGQFDGERMSAELALSRQFGQDVRSVQNLPSTQQAALLATRAPVPGDGFAVSEKRHEALARAIDVVAKERAQDPALSVLRNAPQVQASYQTLMQKLQQGGPDATGAAQAYAAASLAEQQRLEVQNPQILTKDMVDSIAKRFAEPAKNGENVANVMRGMVEQWGRFWPAVGKQLGNKIPPEATVIGLGVTPEAEAILAEASKLKPEQLRQGIPETEIKDLRERIRRDMEPLQRSLAWQGGGIETYDNYADSAEKIATALIQKGLKPKEASAKAIESIIGFKYDFEETWRVPKTALGGETTLSNLRSGAEAAKRDISSDKPILGEKVALAVPQSRPGVRPEDAERQWRDTVAANGFWVTSPGDGGLTLYVKSGLSAQPVLDERRMPVTRSWDQLSGIGRSVRAAYFSDVRKPKP